MFIRNSCSQKFIPLVFTLLLASGSYASAEPLRVGFLCPKPPGQGFWSQVIEVMQAAATDLNIELQVKCDPSASTFGTKRTGEKLLNSDPKLDYFITGYWASVTKNHLALAKERGIKVFVINADIKDVEENEIGGPREKYDNWIGHMVPDDKAAAVQLTKTLVNLAAQGKQKSGRDRVNIYAFIGEGFSTVTRRRNEGLREQAEAMPIADLHEISLEFWMVEGAKEHAIKLITEDSGVDVIGAGSQDGMWGAVQGVEQAGKIPGEGVFIGGFDWNDESIKAIADGRISASMFGHFMEGAWALLLVHDHYYGFDFKTDVGVKINTPMSAITPHNYENYKMLISQGYWEGVDFKKYSKKYNPALKSYNFEISQFLE